MSKEYESFHENRNWGFIRVTMARISVYDNALAQISPQTNSWFWSNNSPSCAKGDSARDQWVSRLERTTRQSLQLPVCSYDYQLISLYRYEKFHYITYCESTLSKHRRLHHIQVKSVGLEKYPTLICNFGQVSAAEKLAIQFVEKDQGDDPGDAYYLKSSPSSTTVHPSFITYI